MPELPTGTVAFLFTDIEGSTRLWEQHPEAMRTALARHDALLRAAIEAHGGHVFETVGDQFCAAFSTAPDALAAALAAQRALQAEPWGETGPLCVRMALHTGAAEARDGDYFGPPLNRVARLLEAGHGGQVLLSQPTGDLAREALAEGASLRDLGEHRLKDLVHPERVFQLLHPDLPPDFPPLLSLDALPNNLPQQVTSFIGREREMAEVKQRLQTTRLLTLTGSGGTGKSRLALQVAADLLAEYAGGVWLVELAALSDPNLVPRAVAAVLGVREETGKPLTRTLVECLRSKSLLLLLDNCEHLLAACGMLADALLRGCPGVQLLATSREGINIPGEAAYRLRSLSAPDPRHLPPTLESLIEYESVHLFHDRAAAVTASFTVTPANASAVAQICHRLDGIPLAIELAAARVRALPVDRINERLDDRFRLLTGGSRTALPRQQTLRALIDWSYDLLSEPERALLRSLSVFAGGWTLEGAELVGAAESIDPAEVLDLLTSLVDKSLVVYEEQDGEERYRLLETIRQYARERLLETGEAAAVRGRHLDWVVALAERAGPELFGRGQATWLARLDNEHDNLRLALDWSLETGELEAGLRIGGSVWRFWHQRGFREEGHGRLEAALAHPAASKRTRVRAKALDGAGVLAITIDNAAALAHYEEMLAIGRELDDKQIMGIALSGMGHAIEFQGDREQARPFREQGLALVREAGDRWETAHALHSLAIGPAGRGDGIAARALWEEALAIWRELGDGWGLITTLGEMGWASIHQGQDRAAEALFAEILSLARVLKGNALSMGLFSLGWVVQVQGDYAAARSYMEERLALARKQGHPGALADALCDLGRVALKQGDLEVARSLFEESLAAWREAGDPWGWAVSARQGLGEVARYQGDYAVARSAGEECLAVWRGRGAKHQAAGALLKLGIVAQEQGDPQRAAALCREGLTLYREVDKIGGKLDVVEFLEACGSLAGAPGRAARAARLLGAAAALRDALGAPLPPVDRPENERRVAAAQAGLGDEAFAAAWAEGRAMTWEQAVEYVLEATTLQDVEPGRGGADPPTQIPPP